MLHRIILLLALACPLAAIAAPLTLDEAWRLAENNHPELRAAQAGLAAVRGDASDAAAWLWNNPQFSVEKRRKTVPQAGNPGVINRDWSAGLAQTFEIAGQRAARLDEAERALSAAGLGVAETRRRIRAEVEQRFVQVLSLQQRIDTEEETRKLVQEAATLSAKRVAAGEDSRLDGNLAKAEAERAHNQVALLREQLIQTRAELAAALQLPPDALPEVAGELNPAARPYTLDGLLGGVIERPLLRGLEAREQAARSRLELERAAIYPDVTVGISTAREGPLDARERSVGVNVSLPLPLFRRNAGGIGRASAELAQTEIERQATGRDARGQVMALWAKVTHARARVARLQEQLLPALEENQRLSLRAFKSGEIGLPQLLLVSRQVQEGKRDLIEARTELRLTTVALEAAAGWDEKNINRAPAMAAQQ